VFGETMRKSILRSTLFALIFLSLCVPVEESDFFWHLATGNWIFENGVLPSVDPFSYTAPLPDSRDLLVLKGYWLTQLLYASFWNVFSAVGTVILRALILTGLFYSVFVALKRRGISNWFALLALLPIFLDMRMPLFVGIRPQLWTFLFVSILVLMLDDFSARDRWKKWLALCFLIVLWNNLHPGALIGYVLVGIYVFCALLKNLTGNREWTALLLLPLLALSVVTPIGLKIYPAMLSLFRPTREMQIYLASNMDGASLLQLWETGDFAAWGFVAVALLCALTVVFKLKKMRVEHLLVIAFLFSLSVLGARYMIFLTILGVQVCLPYWREELARWGESWSVKKVLPAVVTVFIILGSSAMVRQQGSVFTADALQERNYPKGAVDYLKTAQPPGNLFNVYEWGGYLMVFLPEYKVYIDGRGLGAAKGAMNEYLLIRRGFKTFWKSTFEQRGIGVVLSLKDDPEGFDGLNAALLRDPDWVVDYEDDLSFVFVRRKMLGL
jgi:hypothetical protein